ncbi:hypothetical protein [Nonomuraea fuscirosea]|uniref:hypothetical protein n=1 Tax=Nonomuraea fuscirosea TaxID=1291556 RepID=UPI00342E7630
MFRWFDRGLLLSTFDSAESATSLFGSVFSALAEDKVFSDALRRSGTTLGFVHTNPECRFFISGDGVVTGGEAPEYATLTFTMSSDTAHALWSGQLSFPAGITGGKIRILGKVSKVLEVMPVLAPVFSLYPKAAAEAGIQVPGN